MGVVIHTDGACLGNPGPGGFGVVLIHDNHRKEMSGGYRKTTNNRMEVLAAITGLGTLGEQHDVTLYSDSKYLVDAIEKGWAQRWKANGWRRNRKEFALNTDLWEELLNLCDRHIVKFKWVKGHSGNIENERCDRLAVQAANGRQLAPDTGYESLSKF